MSNTDFLAKAPTSWEELWEAKWDDKLDIVTTANLPLIEVTAKTVSSGYEIMETREGLEKVIVKIAELCPTLQQSIESTALLQRRKNSKKSTNLAQFRG